LAAVAGQKQQRAAQDAAPGVDLLHGHGPAVAALDAQVGEAALQGAEEAHAQGLGSPQAAAARHSIAAISALAALRVLAHVAHAHGGLRVRLAPLESGESVPEYHKRRRRQTPNRHPGCV
jgi:hypothetical protein